MPDVSQIRSSSRLAQWSEGTGCASSRSRNANIQGIESQSVHFRLGYVEPHASSVVGRALEQVTGRTWLLLETMYLL